MIYKEREKPRELLIYEALSQRMTLQHKDQRNFMNLEKGYKGELQFDSLSKEAIVNFAVLNDLLFEVNNTTFQIDSLIITGDTAHFFEIKYFEGEHFYEKGRLYRISGKERTNPLIQLKRSETLLRQLFQNIEFPLSLASHVIFIHPDFTLFQAPQRSQFILPTQFNSFIQNFSKQPPFEYTHQSFVNKILSIHQLNNRYSQIPNYHYEQLRKGIKCNICSSLALITEGRNIVCQKCGESEKIGSSIVRSVNELMLLFPKKKITTNLVLEWCNLDCSKKTVQRLMEKNFKKVGFKKGTYYE